MSQSTSENGSRASKRRNKKKQKKRLNTQAPFLPDAKKPKHVQEKKKKAVEPEQGTMSGEKPTSLTACEIIDAEEVDLDAVRAGTDILDDSTLTSGERATEMLAWLVAPVPAETFMEQHFEKAPLLIRRHKADPDWWGGLLSSKMILDVIKVQSLTLGEEVTISKCDKNKKRIDLHQAGESLTLKQYTGALDDGASVRFLCPQTHHDTLWATLSILEEKFGAMVGANLYITPAGAQGFAPHWDDIEAFVIQLEGRKRWRVYNCPTGDLPRFSSTSDLSEGDLGEPILDTVLEPGDLLFMPRGFVHQAETVSSAPSVHVTLSTAQQNAWGDMLELALPEAIASVIDQSVAARRSLPPDYLSYMGVVHSDSNDHRRALFRASLKMHLSQVVEQAVEMIDAVADQMAKRYISDKLPPVLTTDEEARTSQGEVSPEEINGNSLLRVVRKDAARLVIEDGVAVVYHTMDNARTHHGAALRPLEFPLKDAPAIGCLLEAHETPVAVHTLPHPPCEDVETKVSIAAALFQEGFLALEEADP